MFRDGAFFQHPLSSSLIQTSKEPSNHFMRTEAEIRMRTCSVSAQRSSEDYTNKTANDNSSTEEAEPRETQEEARSSHRNILSTMCAG